MYLISRKTRDFIKKFDDGEYPIYEPSFYNIHHQIYLIILFFYLKTDIQKSYHGKREVNFNFLKMYDYIIQDSTHLREDEEEEYFLSDSDKNDK